MTPDREKKLYEHIGLRVSIARDMAGFTQAELGKKVGLTRTSINNLEAGRQRCPVHVMFDIAEALNVNIQKLIR